MREFTGENTNGMAGQTFAKACNSWIPATISAEVGNKDEVTQERSLEDLLV